MLWIAWLVFGLIVGIVVYQTVLVLLLTVKLARYRRVPVDSCSLPATAVILCVRGPDPCLRETIRALIYQDYPDFSIHIVLDSATDVALDDITAVIQEEQAENVNICFLQEARSSCSLKCSALIEALEALEEGNEVLAFIDGDARPHRTWLRELVEPLGDPAVGVSTGNRWYMPARANWGALVRFFWNSGAIVHMWLTGFAWAGSMALRSEVTRKLGLRDAWSRALSVDATVSREIRRHGYQVRFVPSVLLVNDESISLGSFVAWVQRQLMAGRSSGQGWWIVVLHAITLFCSQFAPLTVAVMAYFAGNTTALLISGAALVLFWLDGPVSALILDLGVRRALRGTTRTRRWLSFSKLVKMFPAIVLTYVVYPYTVFRAAGLHRVSWRGVEYELKGSRQVQLVKYQPYSQTVTTGSTSVESVI